MKKILIIEDEKDLSLFIQLELEHEGYEYELLLMEEMVYTRCYMKMLTSFC